MPQTPAKSSPKQHKVARPAITMPEYWNRSEAAEARRQVLECMAICSEDDQCGHRTTMAISEIAKLWPSRFDMILRFQRDPKLMAMAAAHAGENVKDMQVRTLAMATTPPRADCEGWHRDTRVSGFRAFLYLDDVNTTSAGPF
eukprot:6438435-Prymnesium_polylepis.1